MRSSYLVLLVLAACGSPSQESTPAPVAKAATPATHPELRELLEQILRTASAQRP